MPKATEGTMFDDMTGNDSALAPVDSYVPVPHTQFDLTARPRVTSLSVPFMRIAQPMSKEVAREETAKTGDFLLNNYDPVPEVQLIPLGTSPVRQYRPAGSTDTRCQSPDGVQGYGDPGVPCDTCKLASWGPRDPKTGRGAPPPCKDGIAVLAYSVTHGELIRINFMAQNKNVAAFVEKRGVQDGYGNFAVRLQTTRETNDKGTWASPLVFLDKDNITEQDYDDAQRWRELFMASQNPDAVRDDTPTAGPPPARATRRTDADVVEPDGVLDADFVEKEPPF